MPRPRVRRDTGGFASVGRTLTMDEASALFKRHFGFTPVCTVCAPGRLELLGNHTDYNEGLVLALALDRELTLAASPRPDGKVSLVSSAYVDPVTFSVSELSPHSPVQWTDYVLGVLDRLQRHGVPLRGWNAAITSSIPVGAGMSSSAALEVAAALAYRELYPYALTPTGSTVPPPRDSQGTVPPPTKEEKLEMARLCQAAENEFVGLKCGILDQVTCLFGKAFHAVEIDCQSLAIELVPMFGEVALVVCDSGVKHQLASGGYNALRTHCHAAARALGAASLRSVDPKDLAARQDRLTPREFECASHVTGEIRRVLFGARALREGDFEQFGQYMLQSHESSRDLLRNSCPELDLLVELARHHPACLGARLTGGGFGGATINLVRKDHLKAFAHAIVEQYEHHTGKWIEPLVCRVDDGARVVV
jgi:galactokinase